MKTFSREFLCDDFGRAQGPCLGVAAFGKHPGWNDHLDDISLQTPSLIAAKKLFYTNGIGGQIDSGAWEKLDSDSRLPEFHHAIFWMRGGQFIIGRIWRSRDGKGRSHYPMCVFVHACGIPAESLLAAASPELEQIETAVTSTDAADDVCVIIADAQRRLREWFAGNGGATSPGLPGVDESSIIETTTAVLAGLRRNFSAYRRKHFKPRAEAASQHLRVSSVFPSSVDDLVFWTRFLREELDRDAPMLLIRPLEYPWLDLIAGQPASADLFCLRASFQAIPCAVEETQDQASREEAQRILESITTPAYGARPASERNWLQKLWAGNDSE